MIATGTQETAPRTGAELLDGFFLPQLDASELAALDWTSRELGGVGLRMPVVTPQLVDVVSARLLAAQEAHLAERPVMEIVEVLGRVMSRWYEPGHAGRRLAEELLPQITGYAPEMVRRGLRRYLKTFRHDRLLRFLAQDFENPLVLDSFQPARGGGRSRAYGPRLMTQVFSGNVPGLPAWNLICGLLLKSATLGKSAADEPLFPVLFARSVAEEDPELARCLAILHWRGGDEAVEAVAFARAEAVTATGGLRAVESLARRVPAGIPFIPYGHKVSFGVIGHEALALNRYAETARRAATDVSQYDQQGCLSAHVIFVERGGAIDPRTFAGALAAAMKRFEGDRPRATIPLEAAAAIADVRSGYELRAYEQPDSLALFSSAGGDAWTVAYEEAPERFEVSPLNRLVRVHPVDDIHAVPPLLAPLRRHLQTAGIACSPERATHWAAVLGNCGVDRICAIGQMPEPAAGWHHDGRGNLSALVRWVDLEAAAEVDLERYDPEWTAPRSAPL